MEDQIKRLRNREVLSLWDRKNKLFVKIQLNKTDNRICWQRFVSKDKRTWTNWNQYLSLKDCVQILTKIHAQQKLAMS